MVSIEFSAPDYTLSSNCGNDMLKDIGPNIISRRHRALGYSCNCLFLVLEVCFQMCKFLISISNDYRICVY